MSKLTARQLFLVSLCALAVAQAAWSNPAAASATTAGTIYNIMPSAGGTLFFSQAGTRTTTPTCTSENRWVINVTTPAGQTLAAALITAYSLGKQIEIHGSGDCRDYSTTESVDYFRILN
ncbi:hypothetical protein [Nitrospirillum viridazoti]|uniref:hypothetical protein n=1 Tax=Nitrospirillum viridazoti TaxID=3144925 RepID=UPI00110F83C9|nr:hypothetical protein [Nitrospirillum amazonense]